VSEAFRPPDIFQRNPKRNIMTALQVYGPFADAGFEDIVRGFFKPLLVTLFIVATAGHVPVLACLGADAIPQTLPVLQQFGSPRHREIERKADNSPRCRKSLRENGCIKSDS